MALLGAGLELERRPGRAVEDPPFEGLAQGHEGDRAGAVVDVKDGRVQLTESRDRACELLSSGADEVSPAGDPHRVLPEVASHVGERIQQASVAAPAHDEEPGAGFQNQGEVVPIRVWRPVLSAAYEVVWAPSFGLAPLLDLP